ncbi:MULTISPECIES: hypothetical protein [Clostridium]|uniref:hypothetical protein n=1 Tax=Clostridium TaxID=1485 RepID=UPI000825AFC9|nr:MULTISPECIES: hypothetical protein [Clostridium]PJI07263.1 hypothetical protein CUB90_05025 [Clostridium sp. CT7]
MVQDNNIYFDDSMSVYLFDMSSGKLKLLNDDVEQFKINNGYMFYIDHAQKTFTIYKENINDMKSQIILGKGVSKPNKGIYYGFDFIGSDLYFLKRIPDSTYEHCANALYAYKNGNEILMRKNNNEGIDEEMVVYKKELYFATDDSSNKTTLWKYSNKDNTMSKVACLESSKLYSYFIWNTVKIVNGYLYYYTKNYKLRCVKLN